MVQIIQEHRPESTGSRFARAFGAAGQAAAKEIPEMLIGQKQQRDLEKFANDLEAKNPNSPMHKTIAEIYRSPLPMDQKSQMVKTLTGVDPFKAEQQRRLQLDSVLKRYNSRIKEFQTELKDVFSSSEREDLKGKIKALQRERDMLLGDEGMIEEEESEDAEKELPKVQFDPSNKEHLAKFEQLDKKFKGDRKKVNQALAKEFTL